MAKKASSPTKKVPVATKAKKTNPKSSASGAGRSNNETASTRILKALAYEKSLGNDKADRDKIKKLAAMFNKKSFDTTILNMKNKDLVQYDATTLWLTTRGVETVGHRAVAPPVDNVAMLEKLKDGVKGKKPRDIFDILTDGRSHTRAELAVTMGLPGNKSFGTYVSALSKVVERDGKKIRLPDLAFPCGRPCDKEA